MPKKLTGLLLAGVMLLSACGNNTAANEEGAEEETTEVTYEEKDLTYDDVTAIEYGDDSRKVYEALGAPLTEWDSEFVYDSLDSAISRNELTVSLVGSSNDEYVEAAETEIENATKAKEIDDLKMLQYTYIYDSDTEETALFWISPRTDTVVATDRRSFIDENGDSPTGTEGTEQPINDSADSIPDEEIQENTYEAYSIGDAVSFSGTEGSMVNVTIDSVGKFMGDDWDTPAGNFFAEVSFTIENIGSAPVDVNALSFEFYDSDGVKSERISKDYFSETIQAGKTAKGTVYFDILSDGSDFEVFFEDASWTGEYQ